MSNILNKELNILTYAKRVYQLNIMCDSDHGYPSEDLRTCVGFQMCVDVVCFESDIHSTGQLFAEYCNLSICVCGVVFQYICTKKYELSQS